jgi:hypothetical protein
MELLMIYKISPHPSLLKRGREKQKWAVCRLRHPHFLNLNGRGDYAKNHMSFITDLRHKVEYKKKEDKKEGAQTAGRNPLASPSS